MNDRNITDQDIKDYVLDIISQMADDEFRPDYIVGIVRGGIIPAVMISEYLKVPLYALKVNLRDENQTETNCWLAEYAAGWPRGHYIKNILIVNDINDTGDTINWIKEDWQKCTTLVSSAWESNIWHHNVKFAAMVNNEASKAMTDYSGLSINRATDDCNVFFPWEKWWE